MVTLSKPEAIERFHLAFLLVLPQHLPTSNYAVKGGANLRLFFESVRRSEGIDLNFVGRAAWNLQPRVEGAFQSPALKVLLAAQGLAVTTFSASKVTPTTGRWKFELSGPGLTANSKVEFSMRDEDRPLFAAAQVSGRIATQARLRPATANHYLPVAAIEQKIVALALRRDVQARDIFDLDFLATRFSDATADVQVSHGHLELARDRVFASSFDEYRDLVVTYLDPDFVTMYDKKDEWDQMVLRVSQLLGSVGVAR